MDRVTDVTKKKDLKVTIPEQFKNQLSHRFNYKFSSDSMGRSLTRFIKVSCPLCKNFRCHCGTTMSGNILSGKECPFSHFSPDYEPGCIYWLKKVMYDTNFPMVIQFEKLHHIYWLKTEDEHAHELLDLLRERASKLITWSKDDKETEG